MRERAANSRNEAANAAYAPTPNNNLVLMFIRRIALTSLLLVIPVPSMADALLLGVGYAGRDDKSGVELELGYRRTHHSFGFSLIPTGIVQRENDSRYRKETFSSGQTVCRDTTNGQFADKEKCDSTKLSLGLIASLDYSVTKEFLFGGGIRIGDGAAPFIAVGINLTEKFVLGFRAGAGYSSAGLTWRF